MTRVPVTLLNDQSGAGGWPVVEAEREAAIRPARSLAPVLPFWQPRPARAERAAPVAGGVLAALVADVPREYLCARIVVAIDPGAPTPIDAEAARGGGNAAVVQLHYHRAGAARRPRTGIHR